VIEEFAKNDLRIVSKELKTAATQRNHPKKALVNRKKNMQYQFSRTPAG